MHEKVTKLSLPSASSIKAFAQKVLPKGSKAALIDPQLQHLLVTQISQLRNEIETLVDENTRLKDAVQTRDFLNKDRRRSLHWVIKIGNLKRSMEFYQQVFGMKVLRHEEFNEGCDANCNGEYDRPWSKTMVGYGPEKTNFALELTYNYGIKKYRRGNDLRYIGLHITPQGLEAAQGLDYVKVEDLQVNDPEDEKHDGKQVSDDAREYWDEVAKLAPKPLQFTHRIVGPDDVCYHVRVVDELPTEPFLSVALNVTNVNRSYDYWVGTLNMHELCQVEHKYLRATYAGQVPLEFYQLAADQELDFGRAMGRIAFSTRVQNDKGPYLFEKLIKEKKYTIHTNPITLSTAGKADVVVIILQDPEGYEICFVGERGFDELSTIKKGQDFVDWNRRSENGADKDKGRFEQ
jgi:lactoylglutathione lyase